MASRAELVRRVAFGESDVIVTLFTEQMGSVAALARGARASRKRFAGLEPMHQLEVEIDLVAGRDLGALVSSRLVRPRLGLTSSLACLDAAGAALRWLAAVAPAHVAEPALWAEIEGLLDELDAPASAPAAMLGAFGLRLLAAAGWGLELAQCVRCGRACPERSAGRLDLPAGGLVCRTCGGAPVLLTARERRALVEAGHGVVDALARPEDAALAARLVTEAIEVHGRGPR
ncbi:MAG: DNA repair protein RecO [Polyangiaceae bacterium]|nr:DNA repair protein RecO [Polyangiaceae bacterium]